MLLATRPRRSTSAASYSENSAIRIGLELDNILRELDESFIHVKKCIASIRSLKSQIDEDGDGNHVRDAFRHLEGFETLLKLFDFALNANNEWSRTQVEEDIISLLKECLSFLTHCLRDHWGNTKYFRRRVHSGGWKYLSNTLRSYFNTKFTNVYEEDVLMLLGSFLSSALGQEDVDDIFILQLEKDIDKLDISRKIQNPEALAVLFDVWVEVARKGTILQNFTWRFPQILRKASSLSVQAQQAIHSSGLLSVLIHHLDSAFTYPFEEDLCFVAANLLKLGVPTVDDAEYLYRRSRSSGPVANVLTSILQIDPIPPHFHFDLSISRNSSIELPDLRKTFPPPPSSSGYTLSLWFQIVNFDPQAHTTIFGAFDATQTCFLLVYIERDTRNLIVQTSVSSSRPSQRFKSFVFETSKWYHVSIVHKRPKGSPSARVSLHIDGEFVEQVKLPFPEYPPPEVSSLGSNREASRNQTLKPVQVFIGTPSDLAPSEISHLSGSQWKLASAHLYATTLSDELIAVHKELGPQYFGNYQDCLGSFQTYEASAALNLRNEILHPGKEEDSDILAAIRSKAGDLVSEERVLLSISPQAVIDDDDNRNFDGTQLGLSLSKTAQRHLRLMSRGGRTAIVINGSTPSIGSSLNNGSGIAVLTGAPTVVKALALDKAAFSIHGAAFIGLSALESAETTDDALRALQITFNLIRCSWRNSELMERENGYGVLAVLLDAKLRKFAGPIDIRMRAPSEQFVEEDGSEQDFAFEVLKLVLEFIGYRSKAPENSVINNPLAYRVLLVDLDFWRSSSRNARELYYSQFTTFIKGSKHHMFNAKRLARMRVIKKWLDALKREALTNDSLATFIPSFKDLFSVAPATDSMRGLALYIAYALETPSRPTGMGLRHTTSMKFLSSSAFDVPQRRSTAPIASGTADNIHLASSRYVDSKFLGVALLEVYAEVICVGDDSAARKFSRAVSSKWILNLMSYGDAKITILATRIISKVIMANGTPYLDRFCAPRTNGPAIMKDAMKRNFASPELWIVLFRLFFGIDDAHLNKGKEFKLSDLLLMFPAARLKVSYPEFLPVLMAVLQQGLNSILNTDEVQADCKVHDPGEQCCDCLEDSGSVKKIEKLTANEPEASFGAKGSENSEFETIQNVLCLISYILRHSQNFRDFVLNSDFVKELIFTLYPFVVSSDVVSAETELNSRESALTFHGEDVIIRPVSRGVDSSTSIVRTLPTNVIPSLDRPKAKPLRRTSSYVLVTSLDSFDSSNTPRLSAPFSPRKLEQDTPKVKNQLIEMLLDLIVEVFSDQLFTRKEFVGIGLYKRLPPGFQEHQAFFASYVLRNSLLNIGDAIRRDQKILTETRILTNLSRFAMHLREAVYEGWFINGAEPILEFLGGILEHLQKPDIAKIKAVRLCSEIINSMRWVIERIVLLRLSETDTTSENQQTLNLLQRITYWHNVIFFSDASQPQFLKLFFYLLYTKLVSNNAIIAEKATDLWRILLVQQPTWKNLVESLIKDGKKELSELFEKVLEMDNTTFLAWLHDHRQDVDKIVSGQPAALWEDFVRLENKRTEESAKDRLIKRRDRLKQWATTEAQTEDVVRRHEQSSGPWRANIYRQEHGKRLRSIQDEQDNRIFNQSCWEKIKRDLQRPKGYMEKKDTKQSWQLDRTEGPNRMRMRLLPEENTQVKKFQGKEAANKGKELSLDIKQALRAKNLVSMKSPMSTSATTPDGAAKHRSNVITPNPAETNGTIVELDEEFEIVEEMNDGADGFEDKNRKVMRSLERGDRVEHVCNTARVVGLEAIEAILIIGKNHLYIIDNYFVRSDSEIVNIWHAPEDERDPYLQLISGQSTKNNTDHSRAISTNHEVRHWKWDDVLSISKRRFLFREVGIEIFFVDGQSFLLTLARPRVRDDLHSKLYSKAQSVPGGMSSTRPEDSWRLDLLRSPEDIPQTFGSRFSNVFNNATANVATKRWMRGEMSNFHYLMLVNTMAGRTFNDLTQYPVFPWVLADYTSAELDLTNPATFRDLTKPMGCQTSQREAEFRERYKTFAEMGDGSTPPFHYGTHYSSAMIVTSYLVRLPPFVQSYLLLQGGTFDHPDRMFYSIERAWLSASRDNMSDVRELTPEFFYLPEMFVNNNGYDFGSRQGSGGKIDNVILPPWSRGDPRVFVARNREALESEFVSKHLHAWIDLVFGSKQTGEAALEATNLFHHLSYHGAKNLDGIQDPIERVATIGIIHNFGQTPHQVFQKPHNPREVQKHGSALRLDRLAENLTRLPFPVLEAPDRVASIHWDNRREKLVAASPRMVFTPSTYDKFVEWGFVDYGIRFYAADSKKLLGVFEHIHGDQVNGAHFVDSRTLVTTGRDATVSVWNVLTSKSTVDIQLRTNLFAHRTPVNVLSASASFSSLLTGDENGMVISWDLNRLELARVLIPKGPRVDAMAINNLNGWIIIASGPNVAVYSLNGDVLLDQMVSTEAEDTIGCVVWFERNYAEFTNRNIFFTGHKRGIANVWAVDIMNGRWVLEHVKRLSHGEGGGIGGVHGASTASITSILPREDKMYTGDEDGRLVSEISKISVAAILTDVKFEWDCVPHS